MVRTRGDMEWEKCVCRTIEKRAGRMVDYFKRTAAVVVETADGGG